MCLEVVHALLKKHSYLWFRAIISLMFFHMVRYGAYRHKIHDIHAYAFAVDTKYSVISDFFFGGSCEDIVIQSGQTVNDSSC